MGLKYGIAKHSDVCATADVGTDAYFHIEP